MEGRLFTTPFNEILGSIGTFEQSQDYASNIIKSSPNSKKCGIFAHIHPTNLMGKVGNDVTPAVISNFLLGLAMSG